MSGLTNYGENAFLNFLGNASALSTLTSLYVSLHKGDPTDTGAAGLDVTTQVRAAGRVAVSFGAPVSNTGANTMSNDAIVDYGVAANAVDDLTHFALWDAQTGGNMWMVGDITGAPVDVALGAPTKLPVGSIVLSFN
jgi:hypothetical protein